MDAQSEKHGLCENKTDTEPLVTVNPCFCARSAVSLLLILNTGNKEFQKLRDKGFSLSFYCHNHNSIVLGDDREQPVEQIVRTLAHEYLHYILRKHFGSETSDKLDNMRRRHFELACQI